MKTLIGKNNRLKKEDYNYTINSNYNNDSI